MTGKGRRNSGWKACRGALLLALSLGCGSVGCGARMIAQPSGPAPTATELHDLAVDRLQPLYAVRVRATLEYYGEQGRARIRQALLGREPSDVRMESISPFDTTLSVLVLRGGSLRFYDLQNEQFVVGRAVPEHISRLVPLWLTAEDIVRVLLGGPPLDAGDPTHADQAVEWDGRAGAWRWTLPGVPEGRLHVWMRHGTWSLSGAEALDGEGRSVWEMRTGSWESTRLDDGTEIELPTRYRFLLPSEGIDLSLEVERRTLNPELPDELFELPTPRGVETIDLDRLDGP
jgi:hypothetical protein